MNKLHRFRKLTVWQRSIQFVSLIYKITSVFPREEKYGLVDQIRRAAVSICLNIAEGSGAGSDPEFIRFLRRNMTGCESRRRRAIEGRAEPTERNNPPRPAGPSTEQKRPSAVLTIGGALRTV